MRRVSVLLLGMAALAVAQSDITSGIVTLQSRATTCAATDFGLRCQDCSSYMVCNGATDPLGTAKCESPNSYCDSTLNACTNVQPTECSSAASTTFKCPGEGSVPDPDNCQIYHLCDANKVLKTTYTCPSNYVYDALNGYCKRKVYATDCVTMKCTTANALITHKTNAKFYGFCDTNLQLTLLQCEKNQIFNLGCKYVCKAEGYFAGKSKTQFYHCARSGVSYVQTIYDCPTGYEYNDKFNCVLATTTSSSST